MTRVLRYGRTAVLVEADDARSALGLYRAVRASGLPLIDAVPAATTVLIAFATESDCAAALPVVGQLTPLAAGPDPADEVTIPVNYDGEDLAAVAELTGLGVGEVIARHTRVVYEVAFVGFAPGFGYLTGLDPALNVPRLDSPRPRVPAGSVAIAGPYAAVYPTASPGGWRLLGRTPAMVFDPHRDPPALFRPGTRVRFTVSAP